MYNYAYNSRSIQYRIKCYTYIIVVYNCQVYISIYNNAHILDIACYGLKKAEETRLIIS
jgi:hypothetical protein